MRAKPGYISPGLGRGETSPRSAGLESAWSWCGPARSHQRGRGGWQRNSFVQPWRPRRGSGWRRGWSRERKPGGKSQEKTPAGGVSKVETLLYLPSCTGSKDATVHFFPEKFQIPRYSFDMVYYEKLGLYLRGKTFKMMIYLNQRLLARIWAFLPSLPQLSTH